MGLRGHLKGIFRGQEKTENLMPEIRIINYDEYVAEMEKLPKSTGRKIFSEEELKENILEEIGFWRDIENDDLSEKIIPIRNTHNWEGEVTFKLEKTEEEIWEAVFKRIETRKIEVKLEGYDILVQEWKKNGLPEAEMPTEYDIKIYLQAYYDDELKDWRDSAYFTKDLILENGKTVCAGVSFTDMDMSVKKARFRSLLVYEV